MYYSHTQRERASEDLPSQACASREAQVDLAPPSCYHRGGGLLDETYKGDGPQKGQTDRHDRETDRERTTQPEALDLDTDTP